MAIQTKCFQAIDKMGNVIQNALKPSGASQTLTQTGSSIQSTAFSVTNMIRIVASTACYYKIGTDPTATTSDVYLPAASGEWIPIGAGEKIATIAATGTFNIVEAGL